jgi:hypothetical protein
MATTAEMIRLTEIEEQQQLDTARHVRDYKRIAELKAALNMRSYTHLFA